MGLLRQNWTTVLKKCMAFFLPYFHILDNFSEQVSSSLPTFFLEHIVDNKQSRDFWPQSSYSFYHTSSTQSIFNLGGVLWRFSGSRADRWISFTELSALRRLSLVARFPRSCSVHPLEFFVPRDLVNTSGLYWTIHLPVRPMFSLVLFICIYMSSLHK